MAKSKRYICNRWPFLNIADVVKFKDGMFDATEQAQIDLIESRPEFGGEIYRQGSDRQVEVEGLENAILAQGEEAVEGIPEGAPQQGARGTGPRKRMKEK